MSDHADIVREFMLEGGDEPAAVAALDALVAERDEAREALVQLRDAWNAHMATCNQDAHLVPTPEQIDAWAKAPSNTASALAKEDTDE